MQAADSSPTMAMTPQKQRQQSYADLQVLDQENRRRREQSSWDRIMDENVQPLQDDIRYLARKWEDMREEATASPFTPRCTKKPCIAARPEESSIQEVIRLMGVIATQCDFDPATEVSLKLPSLSETTFHSSSTPFSEERSLARNATPSVADLGCILPDLDSEIDSFRSFRPRTSFKDSTRASLALSKTEAGIQSPAPAAWSPVGLSNITAKDILPRRTMNMKSTGLFTNSALGLRTASQDESFTSSTKEYESHELGSDFSASLEEPHGTNLETAFESVLSGDFFGPLGLAP